MVCFECRLFAHETMLKRSPANGDVFGISQLICCWCLNAKAIASLRWYVVCLGKELVDTLNENFCILSSKRSLLDEL
uniref:Uncharacterized protein n=1 Tax=Rhizophora mucronata TaxID=61149 RepID=A0A2P2MPB1_RHIMU